jgi:hypothetical protein
MSRRKQQIAAIERLVRQQQDSAPPDAERCQKVVDRAIRCIRRAYSNGYCWQHGGQGVPRHA